MTRNVSLVLLCAISLPAAAEGPLFPAPFRVEHHVVQRDATGSELESPPVVDTYGGSWLVSVRPDGSRLVVDFARREVTEIAPSKGTYWVLTFQRMGELRRRIHDADQPAAAPRASVRAGTETRTIRVDEVREKEPRASLTRASGTAGTVPLAFARPGVKRLRASDGAASLDAWVDAERRLSAEALAALESFERDALGAVRVDVRGPGELLAAARRKADGAFVLRTERAADGATVVDVVTRIESLPALPPDLLKAGPGFTRVPSPLEAMAAFAEEEAAIRSGHVPGVRR